MDEQNENILLTIKAMLGLGENQNEFDQELMIYINGALFTITELGVGDPTFQIKTGDEVWNDFLKDQDDVNIIKEIVYLRVRLIFDPPSSQFVADALQKKLDEDEWRLIVEVENARNLVSEEVNHGN